MVLNSTIWRHLGFPLSMQVKNSKFRTENELVSQFINVLKAQPQLCNTIFLKEFESPNGIADLILVDLLPGWSSEAGIGKINPEWAYALHKLTDTECFSVDEFKKFAGVSSRRAKKALLDFSAAGFCEQLPNENKWKKSVRVRPITSEICAIEAKLSDWRRALYQATRYQDFANQSWVVMDENKISPALANISQFTRLNVGLAGVDVFGGLYIHHTPNTCQAKSEVRYWYANARIGAELANKTINEFADDEGVRNFV